MDALERLRRSPLPFATLLGIDFTSATPERVTAELVVRPELCTQPAILHGGAIMAFADTLGAAATILNLPEGKSTTPIESKTNFLGPAPVGATVTGETTPIHRGRRTQVWQTRITTAEGKLVAVVTQTQMVL
jgi:1,4-dihydroxy-2-naphthoyl-CoA hydrolase